MAMGSLNQLSKTLITCTPGHAYDVGPARGRVFSAGQGELADKMKTTLHYVWFRPCIAGQVASHIERKNMKHF